MGDHKGNLRSKLAEINATFGISDQWNMSVDMMLGNRSMDYYRVENIHHRDEHKLGLGDTRVTLRYLFENTTFGPGQRMFLGSGLIIPSKNTLQDDPFLMGRNGQRHTHFDLGEGVYKGLLEFQYFNRTQGFILLKSGLHKNRIQNWFYSKQNKHASAKSNKRYHTGFLMSRSFKNVILIGLVWKSAIKKCLLKTF